MGGRQYPAGPPIRPDRKVPLENMRCGPLALQAHIAQEMTECRRPKEVLGPLSQPLSSSAFATKPWCVARRRRLVAPID